MPVEEIQWQGQPALRCALPAGDVVVVALHGAQVLSWTTADGVERLYLSPKAMVDGHSPIRGGVPLCFPQFNRRGPLAKHGFARNLAWTPDARADGEAIALVLHDSDATRASWPCVFRARLAVTLARRRLRVAFSVVNTGSEPWAFTAALHTYLRVDDIGAAQLEGLQGANCWDAVRDVRHVEMAPTLRFDAEFDSVYAAPVRPLRLVQPAGTLDIAQSASCTETVVWNPGAVLCAGLPDMPGDGWRHMLCVEAARIDEPVLLEGGEQWQGWQQLTVL